MSDFEPNDGRPLPAETPLTPATVGDEVYVYHDGGLVGLELGRYPGGPTVTLGLTVQGARSVARDLMARADDVEQHSPE